MGALDPKSPDTFRGLLIAAGSPRSPSRPARELILPPNDARRARPEGRSTVESKVREGARVQVMVEKREDKTRKITVAPHA
jgi:hypothetical protein